MKALADTIAKLVIKKSMAEKKTSRQPTLTNTIYGGTLNTNKQKATEYNDNEALKEIAEAFKRLESNYYYDDVKASADEANYAEANDAEAQDEDSYVEASDEEAQEDEADYKDRQRRFAIKNIFTGKRF